MGFVDPGSISKGLGKLTPQVWRGIMDSVKWVTANRRNLDSLLRAYRDGRYKTERPMFLAKLVKAKKVADNQYIYSWKRVHLSGIAHAVTEDTGFTSTVASDDFGLAAINLMEVGNTSNYTSPGTDQAEGHYPATTYFLQPIGGAASDVGSDPMPNLNTEFNLIANPIVPMWIQRNPSSSDMAVRYVFCASNAHDGDAC